MTSGLGPDIGISNNNYLAGGALGGGGVSSYPQRRSSFQSAGSSGSQHSGADLSSSMEGMRIDGSKNMFSSQQMQAHAPSGNTSRNNIPVKYHISWSLNAKNFTITLLVPVGNKANSNTPFQKVEGSKGIDSNGKELHVFRIPLIQLVNFSNQAGSAAQQQQVAPWLDRPTLRERLNEGGKAIGLESFHIFQAIAAVEESAIRMAEWSPSQTDTVSVDVLLSEGVVSLVAKVGPHINSLNNSTRSMSSSLSQQDREFNGYGAFGHSQNQSGSSFLSSSSFTGDPPASLSRTGFSEQKSQSGERQNNFDNSFSRNSGSYGAPKGSLSSFGLWDSQQGAGGGDPQSRRAFAQDASQEQQRKASIGNNSYGNQMNQYNISSSPPMNGAPGVRQSDGNNVFVNQRPTGGDMNRASSSNMQPSARVRQGRPSPNMIVEPLLQMGFSPSECNAAVAAIRDVQNAEMHGVDGRSRSQSSTSIGSVGNQVIGMNRSGHEIQRRASSEEYGGAVITNEGSAMMQQRDNLSAGSAQSLQSDQLSERGGEQQIIMNGSWHQEDVKQAGANQGPVWGNAGKLKLVKSSSGNQADHVPEVNAGVHENAAAPAQKLVKVLDIPPELNAFVFHCNAHTREECLERGLFGCPSGGQYGPHSKAKKGDLLFLADFSAWTVTGIFTAKSDAGLNLDKNAWNGRFPWQIKVDTRAELRTVHIDKVNEIIGLASGSKLNMLTKDQLLQLVTSKEFGPCVPPHLFKVKAVPQQISKSSHNHHDSSRGRHGQ